MTLAFVTTIGLESYLALRNEQVMIAENAPLFQTGANGGVLAVDGGDPATGTGNLVIGYGWDLTVHSAQETLKSSMPLAWTLRKRNVRS